MSKITSDFVNRNVISNEIMTDTSATKNLTDMFYLNVIPGLTGCMHNIGFNPFGYLIFSGIQVINFILNTIQLSQRLGTGTGTRMARKCNSKLL